MTPSRGLLRASAGALAGVLMLGLLGCVIRTQRPALLAPALSPAKTAASPYLKVHMKSGELYVLGAWHVTSDNTRLEGTGTRYTVQREAAGAGTQSIPLDVVALLETNAPDHVLSLADGVLGGLTLVMGAITTGCVLDPKSCFGSCPTFYLDDAATGRPAAEGFSESIARVLEARDVDALFTARPVGRHFSLTMRNEAQETHAVRRVRLLAAIRPPGGRVLAGEDGRYHPATTFTAPERCVASEGDCLAAVVRHDEVERQSRTDADDLATRETLDLVFPAMHGRVGLVLAARQSLLSTFLFYQTLAYLGADAGDRLATLERGERSRAEQALAMARRLGGVDAAIWNDDGTWKAIGAFDEAGPIAGDVRVLPFESDGRAPIRVRLTLTKGHWRLGWASMARLGEPVTPTPIEAAQVARAGRPDAGARARLLGGGPRLITTPGDAYRLTFELPRADHAPELFLESEGYYYEWMRSEWLSDTDPLMAALAFGAPDQALRHLARPFKAREPTLEAAFWASRFRKGDAR